MPSNSDASSLLLLARHRALHQLIARRAGPPPPRATCADAGRARGSPAHALALVIAARVGADLGVSAAQQRIVVAVFDAA